MPQQPFAKVLLAVFLACVAAATASPDCIAAQRSIPFTSAQVMRSADGNIQVTWAARGITHVQVLASTDASKIDLHHIVAKGSGTGSTAIVGLSDAPRWYFDLVPDHGDALIVADRSLHLATVANLRDVGGYRNARGQWVRMGLAYRSNELDRMSSDDLATLSKLGIKLICDLRTVSERQRGPDVAPSGVPDINADVLADDSSQMSALFAPVGNRDAHPPAYQPFNTKDIYRDFVRLASARQAYHTLFEKLADPARLPTLFHCTAGKDRTGWAAVVLLTLLEVPRATIVQDYVLTNTFLQGDTLKALRSRLYQPNFPSHALIADPADLQAAFDEVDHEYGSFNNYLARGLGLDAATIAAIRANFLAG
jgi:protein-tyrosine phosphatase